MDSGWLGLIPLLVPYVPWSDLTQDICNKYILIISDSLFQMEESKIKF